MSVPRSLVLVHYSKPALRWQRLRLLKRRAMAALEPWINPALLVAAGACFVGAYCWLVYEFLSLAEWLSLR